LRREPCVLLRFKSLDPRFRGDDRGCADLPRGNRPRAAPSPRPPAPPPCSPSRRLARVRGDDQWASRRRTATLSPMTPSNATSAPPGQLAQAVSLLRAGRLAEAGAGLQPLSVRHPDDPAVHRALGEMSALGRDLPAAFAHLQAACRLAPDSADAVMALARLQASTGDFDAARSGFERATRLAPEAFEAWFLLGIAHMRDQRHAEALRPLRQAHRLQPDQPDAARALA